MISYGIITHPEVLQNLLGVVVIYIPNPFLKAQ